MQTQGNGISPRGDRSDAGGLENVIRVLLIDDDPDHGTLLQEYLNEAGGASANFELERTDRLQAGIALAAKGKFGVVLLGLMLPDSRGLDTFYKLRAQAPTLPIIALVDVRHEAIALEAMRQGAQDYLIKGTLDARMLKHVIRYAMLEARLENAVHRMRGVQAETRAA